ETVKYFVNEEMEAKLFDKSMERYEKAATDVLTSLGWLNFGQGVIFGIGTTIMLVLSALSVQRGEQTVGDLAAFEHDDFIGADHRRKPVGDN
ncbi:ABC transporter transmembrane domain-containing protein, partial [Rhizobium leguminosarum]|uniref:ABC transporter transmembrane domain-containing protein n=1 Tax=Rhizobium leguminosarum TaxID=384 RepID=UPI003F9B9859